MLRLFATPKTRPIFPAKTCCVINRLKQLQGYNDSACGKTMRLMIRDYSAGRLAVTRGFSDRSACPAAVERDGSHLMTNRLSYCCALLFSICAVPVLPAQEETQSGRVPTAVASPTATVSSSATPTPAATPLQLTDVLFKNLKARSIGPAVMGGRVSDIAIDPHNPFVFYVGLGHGGV